VQYRYSFAEPCNGYGYWWNRKKVGEWIPALSADDPRLTAFLKAYGWIQ
jgi:hypothetical protein